MTEESQIVVPRSFIDLFVAPGAIRPSAPRAHIAQRYELCEDLAQMLTDQARDRLHDLGIAEADVLERILSGLLAGELVDAAESRWIVRRLAELLDWRPLSDLPAA